VSAPDLPVPPPEKDGKAVDLAPTILARLGVARPDWLDGDALLEGTA
jgi:hypothetical protein